MRISWGSSPTRSSHGPTSTMINHKSFPSFHGSDPNASHLLPTFLRLNKSDIISMY